MYNEVFSFVVQLILYILFKKKFLTIKILNGIKEKANISF